MEKPPIAQTADTKQDRTLEVICKPQLIWHEDGGIGATMIFSQGDSEPNMPKRVNSHGDLKLTGLPANAKYTNNVDITIKLDTSMMTDKNGNPVVGRWATAAEGPVINGAATGFCWFCTVHNVDSRDYDPAPIDVPGMSTHLINNVEVMIDDNTTDAAPDYAYCLGLVLPDYNNYYITLDPMLGSKGVSRVNPTMLRS